MVGEKKPKPSLAEKNLLFLREYLVLVERALRGEPRDIEADDLAMRTDLPEVRRVFRAVDVPLRSDAVPSVALLATAIREWERVDQEAKDRSATLREFLADARGLVALEVPFDLAQERAEIGMALSEVRRVLVEHEPKIVSLRDELGERQHEIERILGDVGRSIAAFPLAQGARHVIHHVATELTAALGAYREWPTTKVRRSAAVAIPVDPPRSVPHFPGPEHSLARAPSVNIVNNNTVNVTTTQLLQHLERAIEAAAPEEKKSIWRDTLKEIAGSAAGAGVKVALDKLLGGGS